jgi:hypothetical protein
MAVGVDHVLLGEDAVGDDEVRDDGVEVAHGSMTRCSCDRGDGAWWSGR